MPSPVPSFRSKRLTAIVLLLLAVGICSGLMLSTPPPWLDRLIYGIQTEGDRAEVQELQRRALAAAASARSSKHGSLPGVYCEPGRGSLLGVPASITIYGALDSEQQNTILRALAEAPSKHGVRVTFLEAELFEHRPDGSSARAAENKIRETRLKHGKIVSDRSVYPVRVQPSPDLTARLETALRSRGGRRREMEQDPASPEANDVVQQFTYSLEAGDFNAAIAILEKIAITAPPKPEAQEAFWQVAQQTLAKRRQRAESLQFESAHLLRETGDNCFWANRPEDLRLPMRRLENMRKACEKADSAITREISARLAEAIQYVGLWSAYLETLRKEEDPADVKIKLLNLANTPASHLLGPRSRLIAKAQEMLVDESKVTPPAAPTDLIQRKNEDGSTDLTWKNNGNNSERIILQTQRMDGKFVPLDEVPPTVTSFHIPPPLKP